MKIHYASISDCGRVRDHNEDSLRIVVPNAGHDVDRDGALFVVADGMGGHRGGEIASAVAADEMVRVWGERGECSGTDALRAALADANARVFERSVAEPDLFGMGTTCTTMGLLQGRAYFVHVGDSRAYLYRDGVLTQLTQDHSLVGEMVRSGILTDEDARHHPRRNVITRSLGIQDTVKPDTPHSPFDICPGDTFVLCSDGLTSMVEDDEIAAELTAGSPGEVCGRLVDLANAHGGRDNISVIIVTIEPH